MSGMSKMTGFRRRIFAHALPAQIAPACLACLIFFLLAVTGSPAWVGVLAGAATGLISAALVSWLWSGTLSRQNQQLVEHIGSGFHMEHRAEPQDFDASVFRELARAWEGASQTFRNSWSEQHAATLTGYQTMSELLRMISRAIDERVSYLRGHSDRVATWSALIAREMGVDPMQVERIRLAGLLHDIGTIGIEDYLVMKETPLLPEEFEIIKAHTVKGAAILRPIEGMQDLIPGVELHHESLDGQGYPYGLRGDDVPLMARIIAVADSFDAMTTPRPYQQAMNPEYVLEVLERLGGRRYDATVVTALVALYRRGEIEVKNSRPQVSFRMRRPVPEVEPAV